MRIGVIGAGALGLYYGALLQRGGHEVHFLMRRDFQAVSSKGLKVTSPRGDFHLANVRACRDSRQIGPVDLALIGLKAYANDVLVELTEPLVTPETTILTLQNGLGNEEVLATAFDRTQIVGGVAFLCCNRGEPGTVHHLDQGSIRIAEFLGGLSPRVEQLAATFSQAGIPDPVGQVLPFFLWEREICSQIEEHPLSGAPLCSDRFDELEGMVFLLGFSISMGCFSDEHGRIVLVAGRSVKQLFNNFGTTNVTENVTR